jgi:hypothetical protein
MRELSAISAPRTAIGSEKDRLTLARMATMQVAGVLGLPFSRVTDLRLAVDEDCPRGSSVGCAADSKHPGHGAQVRHSRHRPRRR